MITLRNLEYLRSLSLPDFPEFGIKITEALEDLAKGVSNVAQQTNTNPTGKTIAPPQIDALNVTGQNGHFNIQIKDNNQNLYRGVHYYVEYDTSPTFSNPHTIHLGDSRDHNIFLGNGSYYWRAYSAYPGSPPSSAAYHGGNFANPVAVQGGGTVGGPMLQASQSSGTGLAGQGLVGPGIVPFRGPSPPKRA
jgi:hypothetical protein